MRRGVYGGDDLHRQCPQLYGQSPRRVRGKLLAQFLLDLGWFYVAFGMVVIGARSEASPYYLSSRAVPALEDV